MNDNKKQYSLSFEDDPYVGKGTPASDLLIEKEEPPQNVREPKTTSAAGSRVAEAEAFYRQYIEAEKRRKKEELYRQLYEQERRSENNKIKRAIITILAYAVVIFLLFFARDKHKDFYDFVKEAAGSIIAAGFCFFVNAGVFGMLSQWSQDENREIERIREEISKMDYK